VIINGETVKAASFFSPAFFSFSLGPSLLPLGTSGVQLNLDPTLLSICRLSGGNPKTLIIM